MSDLGPLVCFMTDFGLDSHYVGVMKGVLLNLVPNARIVDITHEVRPQDVRSAAYHAMSSYTYFPKDTFFLFVVDPGVGSDRKILYAEAGGWRFIAPDNGLLSWVFLHDAPSFVFDVSSGVKGAPRPSKTFHGRDVITPVAGHLLKGEPLTSFGPPVEKWEILPFPTVSKTGALWTGEVLAVDSFGNLVTNIRGSEVKPLAASSKIWIDVGDKPLTVRGIATTYASVEKGAFVALEGSGGFVEIAVRDGSAAEKTGLRAGARVAMHFRV
jgi:S-adenosylmethionine hydrolase